jgi:hypothetical protein
VQSNRTMPIRSRGLVRDRTFLAGADRCGRSSSIHGVKGDCVFRAAVGQASRLSLMESSHVEAASVLLLSSADRQDACPTLKVELSIRSESVLWRTEQTIPDRNAGLAKF